MNAEQRRPARRDATHSAIGEGFAAATVECDDDESAGHDEDGSDAASQRGEQAYGSRASSAEVMAVRHCTRLGSMPSL